MTLESIIPLVIGIQLNYAAVMCMIRINWFKLIFEQ